MAVGVSQAPAVRNERDRWRLGLVASAVLLAAADTYVVVVALPAIMSGVGIGLDRLQRATPIISGFLLGYTAVLPLIGRLADLAGTAPVFAGCLSIFAGGSVVTATAHNLPVAVTGRALQGLGGGGLVPVALAMVAARWAPDERGAPLGVVGAVQELGSVIGPLYGAAVVAVASWRAIFWINVPVTIVVGSAFWLTTTRDRRPGRRDVIGILLLLVGCAGLILALDAPSSLANSASVGQIYTPATSGAWSAFTTPIALASIGALALFVLWEAVKPFGVRPIVSARALPGVLGAADLPGSALLAGVLGCVVVAFSTADPSRQVVASSAKVVGPLAVVLAIGFVVRQRTAQEPLLRFRSLSARPAWGSLLVNLAVGGALMAALVDVPLFARATVDPKSEVAAALVLLRFLLAVPVGALVGGLLCRTRARAPFVAAGGMALATAAFLLMTSWSKNSLGGGPRWSDVELVVCGFGFGLAIAPVNVAVLGAVSERVHALASSLAVVARTIGMLVGLSALTAVALHRFYRAEARIGSAFVLCPTHPTSCPAYTKATNAAVITELHTIFAGAAICAGVAGALALYLLRPERARVTAGRALQLG